jgi:hypothetical protein
MSNEHHDIAALDLSRVDGAGPRTWRLSLFSQILLACVAGRPSVEVMGLRLWVLAERLSPGRLPRTKKKMRRQLQSVALEAWEVMQVQPGETGLEDTHRLLDLLLGAECEPVKLGRRVTLLGYAFERGEMMRAALPSFEVIGELWGLRAENKRSAVCAAMDKLVCGMVERGQLRQGEAAHLSDLWFAKKRAACEAYAAAQMGNHNRAAKVDECAADEMPLSRKLELQAEHAERVRGVPVKAEFARMTPLQLKRHLASLAAAAEERRLASL